ncbi:MAG: AAA family ATPase [Bacteroidetes bacterium]|nr:AAA family ATPase [Bacteroidota bacterium]
MQIQGVSGSGKTYTALALAKTFAGEKGKVALIDTEHGRSELYSNLFDFDVAKLNVFSPGAYIDALNQAARAGYKAVVIDSLSHAWIGPGGVLEIANGVFAGWKKATPEQNRLIEALLSSPVHIISTCRMKTGYTVDRDATGKQVVTKLGLEVVQRDGIEYEFDWVFEMNLDHDAKVIKTPLPDIDGMTFKRPGKDFAEGILRFLSEGITTTEPADETPTPELVATTTAPKTTERKIQ